MSATDIEYIYLTVWNMNGGPVPSDTVKGLTDAVEGILKAATDKNGTRLLYSVAVSEPKVSA
jgi:hypothetical protein